MASNSSQFLDTFTYIDRNGILSDTETDAETGSESESGSEPRIPQPSTGSFYQDYCSRYLEFTDSNPTTSHAVKHFAGVLENAGFEFKTEKRAFGIPAEGGSFYTTRDGQSLVAFVVGGRWQPQKGIGAIGSHVDAITAKLKPASIKDSVSGYQMLGVAAYSGALNHLWLDRDLGIAGKVLVKDGARVHSRLVSSGRHAVCRIPSLAPHFGAASAPLPYNKETQMVPVMALAPEPAPSTEEKSAPLYGKHSLSLLRYVAKLARVAVAQIVLLDLELFDVQSATRGGLDLEFIYAPRIDDRLCSFGAIHALAEHASTRDLSEWDGLSMVFLANHEEIGSGSRTGAKSTFLNSVVERVLLDKGFACSHLREVYANSVILSADVTHALNPNFPEAYLEGHAPTLNKGLTIKLDANAHVMTDLVGVVLLTEIARADNLTLQQFHIRNDKPSGGTIGPMLAVNTGARVIDVGLPQLSMHSIRAATGYKDVGLGVETFRAFFNLWRGVLDDIECA